MAATVGRAGVAVGSPAGVGVAAPAPLVGSRPGVTRGSAVLTGVGAAVPSVPIAGGGVTVTKTGVPLVGTGAVLRVGLGVAVLAGATAGLGVEVAAGFGAGFSTVGCSAGLAVVVGRTVRAVGAIVAMRLGVEATASAWRLMDANPTNPRQ